MANVSQIEDKNGVVKDIVDKGLDEKTSQNSIASSDYVLLEDINGAYHKIAKASFTEAVRSALGAVINSVAKGNDIAKVPVLDSNNDLGMGTLANLASVLGDIVPSVKVYSGDSPWGGYGCTGISVAGNYWRGDIVWCYQGPEQLAYRLGTNGSAGDWKFVNHT